MKNYDKIGIVLALMCLTVGIMWILVDGFFTWHFYTIIGITVFSVFYGTSHNAPKEKSK